MSRSLLLVVLLLAGCGGGEPADPAPLVEADATSGGEIQDTASALRTTTPVPVPQTPIARDQLSAPVQALWSTIEQSVTVEAPSPPAESDMESAMAWAEGPFTEWIGVRAQTLRDAVAQSESVTESPGFDRALAAALIGYGVEDLVASVRGASMPAPIANDSALHERVTATALTLATQSVTYYTYCDRRIEAIGDAEWSAWRAYCVERRAAVTDAYEVEPAE